MSNAPESFHITTAHVTGRKEHIMDKLEIIGRNLVIETKNAANGKFVTTVTNKATDTLVDSKAADNEQDALKDFDDMITTYALPLQARIHAARLERGKHYTLVTMSDFGFPVALTFTFEEVMYKSYAQYDDVATIFCIPKGARNMRQVRLYNTSFALYKDWRILPDDMVFNITRMPNGATVKAAKYDSFDDRYIADICGVWADHIAMYQRPAVKKPEPMPSPDPAPVKPFEIATGLTVMQDDEHGVFVDMTPETFALLYGAPEGQRTAEEILTRALLRAAAACASHIRDEDGGTCNFDSPTLDYKACGLKRDEAERIIKAAGLSCYDWEKQLVITGPFAGQGNRRTKMAEAFCESMTRDGVAAGMYYQMD